METKKDWNYFPGLNGLRFIAATLVVFHHIEQYKFWLGLPNSWGSAGLDQLGHQPVSFFFVLSGFLITYLLLKEQKKKGSIDILGFYQRRVLRIWPLYFVIVVLTISVVSTSLHFFETRIDSLTVLCLVLFIPNLLRITNPMIAGANQLWSVGIEEQFYLFWPLLIRRFSNHSLSFLLVFILSKGLMQLGVHSLAEVGLVSPGLVKMVDLFQVEKMAIGAIGGVFIFRHQNRAIRLITNKSITIISLIFLFVSFSFDHSNWLIGYLEAALFTGVIINVIHRDRLHHILEHRVLKYLGDLSYGIYMWHTIVIAVLLNSLMAFEGQFHWIWNLCLYLGAPVLTIIIAHISYHYLELPFLRFKNKRLIKVADHAVKG